MTKFSEITNKLEELYNQKNLDYGNSFDKSLSDDGLLVSKIRLTDKINRFSNLIKTPAKIKEESIEDTLIDLANYAIMTILRLNKNNKQ